MTPGNPQRKDIYWADLEPVQGSEQGGSRPVLIVSNNLMNDTAPIVLAVPMTRSEEKVKVGPFNIPVKISSTTINPHAVKILRGKGYSFAGQDGVLLCNHARSVSKNRLIEKIGFIHDLSVIKKVEEAIIHSFALNACEDCAIPLRPNGMGCVRCGKIYNIKCTTCSTIVSTSMNFCFKCGEGIKK